MTNILVTGGAGYIGSHMVWDLVQNGFTPIILDNLSNSSERNIEKIAEVAGKEIKVINGDLLRDLAKVENEIDAVMHFAAFKSVPESVEQPLSYYENNTYGVIKLLEWMSERKITKLIFSSTAAVYGKVEETPTPELSENAPTNPDSPYGRSKLFSEKVITDFAKSQKLDAVILRYFNVAGNLENGEIGDENKHPSALIPAIIVSALGINQQEFKIFGNDYQTRDGTAVRDFVHVLDLVRAHRLALGFLNDNRGVNIFNLGSESGITVMEIVKAFEKVTGHKLDFEVVGRRPGDIAVSIADATKARLELNWSPELGVEEMIRSTWEWYKQQV